MNPIMMNLIFFRSPQKPKEEGIYWCIVKHTEWRIVKNTESVKEKTIGYHYHFVPFHNGVFTIPEDIEVMAWCELENPEQYFKEKPLIIPTM